MACTQVDRHELRVSALVFHGWVANVQGKRASVHVHSVHVQMRKLFSGSTPTGVNSSSRCSSCSNEFLFLLITKTGKRMKTTKKTRIRKILCSAPIRRAKIRQKTTKKVGWPPPSGGGLGRRTAERAGCCALRWGCWVVYGLARRLLPPQLVTPY
jgi:hypothetical protein